MTRRSATAQNGDVAIAYEVQENAESVKLVVMVPSFARGPGDFTGEFRSDLAERVAEAGYRVVLPTPRGFGSPTPVELSLEEMAADLAVVIEAERGDLPVAAVGHAYGNRVVRMLATVRPDIPSELILLAAGERTPGLTEVNEAIRTLVLPGPEADKRAALKFAFFAERDDPGVWIEGWDPTLAMAQSRANTVEAKEKWRAGGGVVPMHVVQASEDIVSPPEVGSALLRADFPDRVTVSIVENAGHALLPEQPYAVAAAVLGFLSRS